MKKSIRKNYLYNLFYQVLAIILPIITTPYVSRVLGAENIGIYGYTLSISAYFILFGSLGMALYGQREIAFVQDNKKEYSKIFFEIFFLRLITMIVSTIIFYFAFIYNNNDYSIYFKVLTLELFANTLDISWFFQGLEEFKITVTRNTIVKLISFALIFLFVKTKNDLFIYFIIYVLSLLLGNISLWFTLPKYIVKVNIKNLNLKKHIKPTLALFIPQIAVQVYTILDRTMIGVIIADKSEVGYYEQAQKIIKLLLTIITSLGIVMLPRVANSFSNGNNEEIKNYMNKSFNMVFLLAFPMIFGIICISNAFVPIFFGPGYEKVSSLMNIISPIILFIGLSNVTGTQFLLPTKRQREYTISVIVGACINFCMNMLLIPKYGAIGASIGTVIAEFTVTSVQAYYVRNDFDFKNILLLSKNYFISGIIMFVTCFIISILPINSILMVLLELVIGIGAYTFMLYILKDNFFMQILDIIKRKLKIVK
jgi:O-antigen/teichoic acid export membrane protein